MSAADPFTGFVAGFAAPCTDGCAVEPSDTEDLATVTRAIFVGGAGSLKLTLASGATVVLAAVAAGTTLPVRATRGWSGGTSATSILALW